MKLKTFLFAAIVVLSSSQDVTAGLTAAQYPITPGGSCSSSNFINGAGTCASTTQQLGISGCGTAVATAVTNALMVGGCATPVATANSGQRQVLAASTGTFSNLYASQSTTPSSATTSVYTLVVNSSNTAVTCTIAAGATTCNDTTHTAAITAGQAYWITVNNTSTGSTGNIIAGVMFANP